MTPPSSAHTGRHGRHLQPGGDDRRGHGEPRSRWYDRGLSLIELMIGMAIGLVLIATVGYAYLGAKTSFNAQNALAQVQENARYAFEFMGLDIRMAGHSASDAALTTPTDTVADSADWDPNLKHLFDNDVAHPNGAPLIGYEEAYDTGTDISAFPTFPVGTPRIQGDALTVVRADDENVYRVTAYANPTFTLGFTSCPTSGLPAAGEIFVAADYTHAAVFQIQAVSACAAGAMTVTADNNSGTVTPGSSSALGAFNATNDAIQLYRIHGATYYIADNAVGEPSLYRLKLGHSTTTADTTPEELVEGVSNMQITYGVDTDATADNNVNAYCTADLVNAGAGSCDDDGKATAVVVAIPGATPQEWWRRVLSVRVTLTLTTKTTQRVAADGGQLEKSFTTTFAVRNRL